DEQSFCSGSPDIEACDRPLFGSTPLGRQPLLSGHSWKLPLKFSHTSLKLHDTSVLLGLTLTQGRDLNHRILCLAITAVVWLDRREPLQNVSLWITLADLTHIKTHYRFSKLEGSLNNKGKPQVVKTPTSFLSKSPHPFFRTAE